MNDHVMVISHRRSGTHFMIDAIRNNFDRFSSELLTIDQLVYQFPDIPVIPFRAWASEVKTGPRVFKSHMHADVNSFFQNSSDLIPFVVSMIDSSKVIYMYRDGRDVLTSLYWFRHSFEPGIAQMSFSEFIRMPNDFGGNPGESRMSIAEYWNYHVCGWIEQGNVLPVSFEELRNNYKHTMKRVAQFLNLALPETIVEVTRQRDSAPAKVTSAPVNKWLEHLYKLYSRTFRRVEYTTVSFRKGVVGDFKEFFSDDDLSYFDSIAQDVMARLGYQQNAQTLVKT